VQSDIAGIRSFNAWTISCTSERRDRACADRNDGVVDAFPNRFIAEERKREQCRYPNLPSVVDIASTCAAQQFPALPCRRNGHRGCAHRRKKAGSAALANDLRQRLRDARHELVHEMKTVPDIFDRGRIFRDPVVARTRTLSASAQIAIAWIDLSRREMPQTRMAARHTMTFAPLRDPTRSAFASAVPVEPPAQG